MNKRSSDHSLQDDPLMRLADQSCIEEVTRLLKAVSQGTAARHGGQTSSFASDETASDAALPNDRSVRFSG